LVEEVLARIEKEMESEGLKARAERAGIPQDLQILLEMAGIVKVESPPPENQDPSPINLQGAFDEMLESKNERSAMKKGKPKTEPLTPAQMETYKQLLPLEGEPEPEEIDEEVEGEDQLGPSLGDRGDPLGSSEGPEVPDLPQETPARGLMEEEVVVLELPILQRLQRLAMRKKASLDLRIVLLLFLDPPGLGGKEIAFLTGYNQKNINRVLTRLIRDGMIQKDGKKFILKDEDENGVNLQK